MRRYTWGEIWGAMQQRRSADSERFARMISIRDRANGDMIVPLPDVDGEPTITPPSPQLILDVIDSTAMQANSQSPVIYCPAMDPTRGDGIMAKKYAEVRRNALYASWQFSAMELLKLRYYRHLVGYGTGCMLVVPDMIEKRARVELRDPLTVYPALRSPEDIREPINVGLVYGRSRQWLEKNYGDNEWVQKAIRSRSEDLYDVVEWIDEEEIVIGVLGPRRNSGSFTTNPWTVSSSSPTLAGGTELRRWPNRAGMVPVAIPRRVTLDKTMGQVDTVVGTVDLLTHMHALAVIAAEKGVFPDLQVIGTQGRPPQLLGDQKWHDGRTGEANVIIDGEARYLTSSLGPATFQIMADLERSVRLSSGNSSLSSGEVAGSLRSGQTVNALAAYAINPRVVEMHAIAERALQVVNKAIIETEKGYWPDKKYTVFSGNVGGGMVEYTPSKHFEISDNVVRHPFPGYDLTQVTMTVANLNAAGLISKKSARVAHPFIADADQEDKDVLTEQLDQAYLAGLLTRMASGDPNAVTDIDFVTLRRKVAENGDLAGAVEAAHKAAQERQVTQAPPPGEGQTAAPETAPGLAAPGAGAEQPESIPGMNDDQKRLAQAQFLLRAGRS